MNAADSDTGRCAGAFDIDAQSGRITTTRKGVLISRLTPYCTLKVSASDGGKPPCQTIRLLTVNFVESFNDNSDGALLEGSRPSSGTSYNVSLVIDIGTPPGTVVGHVNSPEIADALLRRFDELRSEPAASDTTPASSSDVISVKSSNGQPRIVYRIASGNVLDSFGVDSMTGALYVARPVSDAGCSTFRLHLEATICSDNLNDVVIGTDDDEDNPEPFARIRIIAVIRVSDVEAAIIQRSFSDTLDPIRIVVHENTPVGAVVFDATSVASLDGNFPFSSSGEIPRRYSIVSQSCSSASSMNSDDVAECAIFQVDIATGHVTLVSKLNAEGNPKRIVAVIGFQCDEEKEVGEVDIASPSEFQQYRQCIAKEKQQIVMRI